MLANPREPNNPIYPPCNPNLEPEPEDHQVMLSSMHELDEELRQLDAKERAELEVVPKVGGYTASRR